MQTSVKTGMSALGKQLVSTLEDLELADDIALLTHRLQDVRCKMEGLLKSYRGENWIKNELI